MSKHETWRTRKYWKEVGGLLIEEFVAVEGNKFQGRRVIDAVIILGEKEEKYSGNFFDVKDKDVIVVQTKTGRIGMYLLGQAFFSKYLLEMHKPRSIRSVAICGRNDPVMAELAVKFDIEIVVIADAERGINQEVSFSKEKECFH
jgi:hypothetical protein